MFNALSPAPSRAARSRDSDDAPVRQYLSAPRVCRRYGISAMTLARWLRDPRLGFPGPNFRVRDRRFWLEETLTRWERAQATRKGSRPTAFPPPHPTGVNRDE
jgi:hypothetical protein